MTVVVKSYGFSGWTGLSSSQHEMSSKPALRSLSSVSAGFAKFHIIVMPSKWSMYCGCIATVAMARACSATLPSPPHWATSLPPGRSTEWIRENSLS